MKNILTIIICVLSLAFCNSCEQAGQKNSKINSASQAKKKTLVLAIDGGGIKGVIPAYFLSQVEAALNNTKSYQLFDVIGGTSTGGIITIGLTAPFNSNNSPRTAEQLLNVYLNDCGKIFFKNHQTYSVWPHPPYGPSYYADSVGHGIEPFLQSLVSPTLTLKDAASRLPNKKVKQVFTTAYLINSTGGTISNPQMGIDYGPYLFNWMDATQDNSQNYYLWEAARATGAAPTYFPVANVGGGSNGRSPAYEKWAVDGGVMSNDPAMWAVAESLRAGIASDLDDLVVISIGCGLDRYNAGLAVTNEQPNTGYGQKSGFWGSATWVTPLALENLNGDGIDSPALVEAALYANQFVPASQLEILAQNTGLEYYRIQVDLPANLTPMDMCSNASGLKTFAANYFGSGQGKDTLDAVVNVIKANL